MLAAKARRRSAVSRCYVPFEQVTSTIMAEATLLTA
jgi:hypothetical protein